MQKQVQNIILEMTEDQFHVLIGGMTLVNLLFNTHPAQLVTESHAQDKVKIGIAIAGLESRTKAMSTLNDNLAKMVEGLLDQSNI
jgi:dihydroxyacetone kinase